MTNHTTIARHLNATSFTDADKRLLHQCFLAAVGPEGAAPPVVVPAPESVEPAGWVIEDTDPTERASRWRGLDGLHWCRRVTDVTPFATESEARSFRDRDWNHSDIRILPYAEALRLDAAEQAAEAERAERGDPPHG